MSKDRKPLQIIDFSHPFYIPRWRRIAIVAVTASWAVLELFTGNPVWAAGSGALSAFLVWGFFLVPLPVRPAAGIVAETTPQSEEQP